MHDHRYKAYESNKSILYVGNKTPPSTCTSTVNNFLGFQNYIKNYGCPPQIIFDNVDAPTSALIEWLIDKDQHSNIIPPKFAFEIQTYPESQRNICRCMLDRYLTSKALA